MWLAFVLDGVTFHFLVGSPNWKCDMFIVSSWHLVALMTWNHSTNPSSFFAYQIYWLLSYENKLAVTRLSAQYCYKVKRNSNEMLPLSWCLFLGALFMEDVVCLLVPCSWRMLFVPWSPVHGGYRLLASPLFMEHAVCLLVPCSWRMMHARWPPVHEGCCFLTSPPFMEDAVCSLVPCSWRRLFAC